MFWPSFVALLGLQGVCAVPTPHNTIEVRKDAKFTVKDLLATAPEAELKKADSILNLKQVGTKPRSSQGISDSPIPQTRV